MVIVGEMKGRNVGFWGRKEFLNEEYCRRSLTSRERCACQDLDQRKMVLWSAIWVTSELNVLRPEHLLRQETKMLCDHNRAVAKDGIMKHTEMSKVFTGIFP